MSLNMSKTQLLREFITERLTAAATEIFGAVERTVAEYEEKLYSSHLQIQRQEPQQLTSPVCPEEVPPKQYPCEQERSPSLGLEDPEPLLLIKEEPCSPEEDQVEELEMETDPRETMLNRTSCVKSEYDQVQPESGESCRSSQPTSDCLSFTGDCSVAAKEYSDEVFRENGDIQKGPEKQKATKETQTPTHRKSIKPPLLQSELHDLSFPNESSLKNDSEVGKSSDAYKYFCEICGKSFTRNTGLKGHMMIHTGEKPFKCIVCGKEFIKNTYLKLHLRKHSGEKPYSCSDCGKQFSQLCSLKTHRMTHTGEKPFKCAVCGKGYIQSVNLKFHMKRHSVEN